MTDIHAHVVPNVDDGSKSLEDSISLLKRGDKPLGLHSPFSKRRLRGDEGGYRTSIFHPRREQSDGGRAFFRQRNND